MNVSVAGRTGFPSKQSIEGWEDYFRDGEGFLKTAASAYEKQKKVFTPQILYNMIAMSMEKFIMSALMRHGAMPNNHTMKDLVEAMDETFPSFIDELRDGLLRMDRYQEICNPDGFRITPPGMKEIPGMLKMAEKLQVLVTVQSKEAIYES